MTTKRYLEAGSPLVGFATVTELGAKERPYVRLSETLFHPQGGGQRSDTGFVGPARVIHVAHSGDEVDHFLESPDGLCVGFAYPIEVDEKDRRANTAYHSAGHLLASLVERHAPALRAISAHQWPGEARVEFAGLAPDLDEFKSVIEVQLAEIRSNPTAVSVVGDPFVARAIQIGDFPPILCGGTHVQNTVEIGDMLLGSLRFKSGRLRMRYGLTQ